MIDIGHETTRPPQFGLIVLQADETLERDMRWLMPDQAECLVSRVPSAEEVRRDTLREMEDHLVAAASLLPRGAKLQGVAYGCTSGTAEIGPDTIASLIRKGVTTPLVTQPVSALIAAARHLGVAQLGLVSPYVEEVSHRLREVLDASGISTTQALTFNEPTEETVVRIDADTIRRAAIEVGQSDAVDAVFLSCTNLRTLNVIEDIERTISKPVMSSNQVLAWHLCHAAGLAPSPNAPGRLFRMRN